MHDRYVAPTKEYSDLVVYWKRKNPNAVEAIAAAIEAKIRC